MTIARPESHKIEFTLEDRRGFTKDELAQLNILEETIYKNRKIVFKTWDGEPVLAEVARLYSEQFSFGKVLTTEVKTNAGKNEIISAILLKDLELQ